MTWIKQNKFLTGFLAIMLVGVGVLGFLLLSAKGQYEEVQADYETKTAELNRLETQVRPYPEAANLKQFDAQKKEHAEAIAALQKNLAAQQLPLEPLAPEQFQDRLREAVTRITAKANDKGVKLPERFFLGFDPYQGAPPRPEAAAVLGRQLKATEIIVNRMLDAGVVSIGKFVRETLPEEDGKSKKPPEAPGNRPGSPPNRGRGPAGNEASAKGLVTTHSVEIEFNGDQSRMRGILNDLVANKTQFFIPRFVSVTNEKDVAPPKQDPAAAAAAAAASFGQANVDPNAAPAEAVDAAAGTAAPVMALPKPRSAEELTYIFGAERLNVRLIVDVVDFAEVAAR